MTLHLPGLAATSALLVAISAGGTAFAQKQGGVLRMYSPDSPASMSILEEATVFAQGPMMGVFNNLVMFDQHVKQNSLASVVPDLATGWSWNEEGTEVTFPLRQGVKWHDGRPFTAQDVKCTWDLITGKSSDKEFIVALMPAEAVKGFAEPVVTYAVRGVQPILSRLTTAEERDNVEHT